MKRLILAIFAGGIGGIAIGFAVGIFIYPFWFLNDAASEQLDSSVARTTIATGEFIQANPNDPVHKGKGAVTLYQEADGTTVVFLGEDFEVGPGPKFYVYLADSPNILSSEEFKAANTLDLGRLRAFRGSQVYQVPLGTDISAYQSVVIWCKEFGVLISPAAISKAVASTLAAGGIEEG